MNFVVVIPNKHSELAANLIRSILQTHDTPPQMIVVADNHDHKFGSGVVTITSTQPFIFARNVNLGIEYANKKDVILVNDDCEFTQKDSLRVLVSVAARFPRLGILSPLIDGGVGNPYQMASNWNPNWPDPISVVGQNRDSMPVCFPCVYLSRAMINAIELLDTRFVGYGFDDNDYCLRARRAGWETGITGKVTVKHGSGGAYLKRGENWSTSFARDPERPSNEHIFRMKYPPVVEILK